MYRSQLLEITVNNLEILFDCNYFTTTISNNPHFFWFDIFQNLTVLENMFFICRVLIVVLKYVESFSISLV